MSWTSFIAYLVYFMAFMLLSHLITIHECKNLNISDKIVVSIATIGFLFQTNSILMNDVV